MIFSKASVVFFCLASISLAQSLTSSLPTTSVSLPASPPTNIPSISGTLLSCMAFTLCDERVTFGDYSDSGCKFPTTECQCVAWNSTGYANCLKGKCPDNWEAIRDVKIKTCTETYKVDLSGNTTYTGVAVPTNVTLYGGPPSDDQKNGLSQSDKIAIGIGVGFGFPTILVGLGAWLCARRRKDKTEKERDLKADGGLSP